MTGYVDRLELHFAQTAFPHFLQWCCREEEVDNEEEEESQWQTGGTALGSGRYLSEAQGFGVPHLLDVPEEGLLALLAGVAVQPLWRLQGEEYDLFCDDKSRFP